MVLKIIYSIHLFYFSEEETGDWEMEWSQLYLALNFKGVSQLLGGVFPVVNTACNTVWSGVARVCGC